MLFIFLKGINLKLLSVIFVIVSCFLSIDFIEYLHISGYLGNPSQSLDLYIESLNGIATIFNTVAIFIVISLLIYSLIFRKEISRIFKLNTFSFSKIKVLIIVYFVYAASCFLFIIYYGFPQSESFSTAHNSKSFYFLFSIVVIAPICEELFFRGYLFYLFDKLNKYIVFAIVSVLFALLHGPESSILFVFFLTMSLILGGLRLKSDSTLPAISIHTVHNFIFGFWFVFLGV